MKRAVHITHIKYFTLDFGAFVFHMNTNRQSKSKNSTNKQQQQRRERKDRFCLKTCCCCCGNYIDVCTEYLNELSKLVVIYSKDKCLMKVHL